MADFVAMALYAFSLSITPGPINLLLFSIGGTHRYRKALPLVLGATVGFVLMLLLMGLGMGQLLERYPDLIRFLTLVGAGYIAYMGYRTIVSSSRVRGSKQVSIPKFYEGFLLQWLNPKAWIASLSGVSAFGVVGASPRLAVFASLYFVICFFSEAAWAYGGDRAGRLLKDERHIRRLNMAIGVVLIGLVVYLGLGAVTGE